MNENGKPDFSTMTKEDVDQMVELHNMLVKMAPVEACAAMFATAKQMIEHQQIALAMYMISEANIPDFLD